MSPASLSPESPQAPKPQLGASRILLFLDNRENAQLLAAWLGKYYEVVVADRDECLDDGFDLCMLDGPALKRLWRALQARKAQEPSVFLPYLLITPRQDVGILAAHLWKTLDEVVFSPIEKLELQARVEMVLRARRLSLELKLRNDDLEAFIHAMTHDLRAPLRTITGFAEALAEEPSAPLEPAEQHQVARIQSAAQQMWELIASLLEFSRLGRRGIRLRSVAVRGVLEGCLANMQELIQTSKAEIVVGSDLGSVEADPSLLKIAFSNVLSNAVKFVAPGTRPCVRIGTVGSRGVRRIMVEDNGIGLAPEDQHRIFTPFVRLHGVEDYPGIGLGLSAVRKVVEMMGGQIGVQSAPGEGSTFWIELADGGVA